MADNIAITPGSGATYAADELTDGTLGSVKVGYTKIMDGTLDSSNKAIVNSSGELTVKPTANSQVDMNKVAGTTTDTNSGSKSAGTLRVVLATDQPALTNKLLVTPDLPTGAATAAKQPALGTAGTASTDVITVQGIASGTALPVSVASTTLTGTSDVNVKQINGITPLMGNGVTGTGSQRVTVASDNTPFPVKTDQTTHGTTDLVAADITKVAGSAISQGHGTAATAIRVELPTDGTGNVTANAGTNLNTSALATSTNVTGGGQKAQIVDGSGNVISSTTNFLNTFSNTQSTASYPMYDRRDVGLTQISTDSAGAVQTFSEVTTDEGTSRVSFANSSLSTSPGTATFVNGSTAVTGTGFTSIDAYYMDYVKLNADGESAWAQIGFINSDTSITLLTPYTGSSATGTYNLSPAATITGTGATISVASGQATVALGTNTSATTNLFRAAGAPPIRNGIYSTQLSVSQRIANQDIYVGLESSSGNSSRFFARFHFTGTNNTQVVTETAYNPSGAPSTAETESNTVTIPSAFTTASINKYKIIQEDEKVTFYINDVNVAVHYARLPHVAIQTLYANIRGVNSGSVTATSVVTNYIYLRNYERVDNYQSTPTIAPNDVIPAAQTITAADVASVSTAQQNSQNAITGTPTANSTASFSVSSLATTSVSITGTWVATLSIEISFNNGTTWFTRGIRLDGTNIATGTITSNASGSLSAAGATNVRVRCTAYTSGTVNVAIVSSLNPALFYLSNPGSMGAGTTAATAPTIATETGQIGVTALPTAVTNGQLVGAMGDKYGRAVVITGTIRDLVGTQTTTISASTSETTIVTAAASVFNDLTALVLSNTSATAARIDFRDTTAGSILFSIYIPAGDVRGVTFNRPVPQTSVNTNWTAQSSASVTDLRVYAVFDKNR